MVPATSPDPDDHVDRPFRAAGSDLGRTLGVVPRSARWVIPSFAAAFHGTGVSTVEPKVRALVLLRVASVDRAPYWRVQHEAAAAELGITDDEIGLVTSDEWETAPAFSDRERAAILWADRVARRLARRDAVAYREVRERFTEAELVELTAIAALAAMGDRLTNALRISPEPPIGLSPDGDPIDDELVAWSRSIADGDAGSVTVTVRDTRGRVGIEVAPAAETAAIPPVPPRVPIIDDGPELDAGVGRIFDGARELLAFVSNFARTITYVPSIARWVIPMVASIQRGGSDAALDPRLKELVILKTSTRNRCFF